MHAPRRTGDERGVRRSAPYARQGQCHFSGTSRCSGAALHGVFTSSPAWYQRHHQRQPLRAGHAANSGLALAAAFVSEAVAVGALPKHRL